jgi:osmotically inducible protein OsmC
MVVATRPAQTTWEVPLATGTGPIRMGSNAASELSVTWASRAERADGKSSPEELAAAAHSARYAMALALRSHLDVTAAIPGLTRRASTR